MTDSEVFTLGTKNVAGRMVMPSGIRCVRGSTIGKTFAEIPSVGVITTKSLSFDPRAGYREPVYARFSTGSYINAVGLANPGARAFLGELEQIQIPLDKFLLVSIFGADIDEFCRAAEAFEGIADGFELNMSCPHASGYGLQIGQDIALLSAITRAVCRVVRVPIFVKLSATLFEIKEKAQAAIGSGATGISVSNSIGPSLVEIGNSPILHNGVGGLSGNAIRPLCLFAVQDIRSAIGSDPIIIAMGGIGTSEHIRQYREAGANLFGVGSAITGLTSPQVVEFFNNLAAEVKSCREELGSEARDSSVPMRYHPCTISARLDFTGEYFEIKLSSLPNSEKDGDLSGRYYFLCIPGVGEKPFYVVSAEERTLLIKKVGPFTMRLGECAAGSSLLIRGPYGVPFEGVAGCSHYVLTGDAVGSASLLEVAHRLHPENSLEFLVRRSAKEDMPYLNRLRKLGPVTLVDDSSGSEESPKLIESLVKILSKLPASLLAKTALVVKAPQYVIEQCIESSISFLALEKIICGTSLETSCGVGICGKCATPTGHLACIDGPFISATALGRN